MRHPRLNSDAKILLIYVQGLPDIACDKALGEHANDLGMKPRAYSRAKEALAACGFLHEWKEQNGQGRWTTEQLISNVTLTREEASAVRDGVPVAEVPDAGRPTVGFSRGRGVGGQLPRDEDWDKTYSHPPTKAQAPESEPEPEPAQEPREAPETPPAPEPEGAATPEDPAAPEVVVAERVLLSLRHQSRDLLLGVREARGLAEAAAEWLRRGVSVADLRHALTAHLPRGGVRSAVGFLRHRLTEKLPAEAAPQAAQAPQADPQAWPGLPAPARPAELVTCDGPGNTHVFRPAGDETFCGPCRTEEAWKAHERRFQPRPEMGAPIPWRERVDAILQAEPS